MLDWLKRKPDLELVKQGHVYLQRWHVIPRNRWFNVYLHRMLGDDDPRALHDHPWWNLSIVLKGGYWEYMPADPMQPAEVVQWAHDAAINYSPYMRKLKAQRYQDLYRVWRKPGSFVLRRPTDAHRIALSVNGWPSRHSWSLFLTGPLRRTWGFWLVDGWVNFREARKRFEST